MSHTWPDVLSALVAGDDLSAEQATWAGVASPARISPIAQLAWVAVRSWWATRAESTSGHVGVTESDLVNYAGTRERSSEITDSASWTGSRGWGHAASARDQVASQASCGRPVSTSTGGHW